MPGPRLYYRIAPIFPPRGHTLPSLTDYRTLGRSGLVVSPMALGTMTFGTPRWGSPDEVSEAIFDAYTDAGGNFVDTADVYSKGRSEELVGGYLAAKKLRDKVVLATKSTFSADPGNPNGGGNGRKHMFAALEGSLRRLKTDYVDLYWLHAWDMVTPVEEVLQSMGDLVRAGKVRYYGLSDIPAWYAAKAATLAATHGVPGPVAVQMEYSLTERCVEWEHAHAARDCGLGITPWSPLAGGFLAGKYTREAEGASGEGRLMGANPFGDTKFTERNWRTLGALKAVAAEVGRPPSQVALAWLQGRPGVTSTILGASKVAQLRDNLASLELTLSPGQTKALDAASAPEASFYAFFQPQLVNKHIFNASVQGWK